MAVPVSGVAVQTSSTPGESIIAISANQAGGYIVNPFTASDQGLSSAEILYVNQVTDATIEANNTTISLQPGQIYVIIPFTTTPVRVASAFANHKFTAVSWPAP